MDEVTSPRITFRKPGLRLGVAAGLLALTGSLTAVPAAAEDLPTLRERAAAADRQAADAKARAEAAAAAATTAQGRAAASEQQVTTAQGQVQGSQQQVQTADAVLAESERALAAAHDKLYKTRAELQAARDYDARLAADLAAAQEQLARARAAVAAGERAVARQQELLGQAAREAWQQQTPLEGLAFVLGSESLPDLSQRVQWADTVFDTQVAEKAKLDTLQVQLRAARDEQTLVESKIAADKAAAAAQVEVVAGLERRAAEDEARVAQLVVQHQAALEAAQAQLATDESALSLAKTDQAQAQAQLTAAQGELAASRDEVARADAEARQRQQRVKDEIARQKALEEARRAEEARAAAAEKAAQDKAAAERAAAKEYTLAPHEIVSSSGFVRPIDVEPGSPFGMRFHPILHYWRMHEGVDFGSACWTPIYAARSGTVLQTGPDGGYGNYTLIGHGTLDGAYVTTGYAHQNKIIVSEGQRVSRGQLIGYVGSTGLSTTCHLHFEVRRDGTAVNPLLYIP